MSSLRLRRRMLCAIFAAVVPTFATVPLSWAEDAATALPRHKLAIHVTSDDESTQQRALDNAAKAHEMLKPDVAVAVVTYGPGMSLVTRGGKQEARVSQLIRDKGVRFHVCEVTVSKAAKKRGKAPELVEGVEVVPSGTVKLLELQEQGYAYLKP